MINNFQSHKRSELEFDPGLNIIVGKSDSGKTAILRALRWLIWNRPGGDAFRSTWGGETLVSVETKEGNVISRSKDGVNNLYQLNDLVFAAFGTTIPDEVLSALNMGDINLQNQFDQPFLLTSTPGEIAAHFNKLAHIDQIDVGTKKVKSWIVQIESDIKAEEKTIEKTKEDLIQYENLEKIEARIEVLEESEKQMVQIASSKSKLIKLSGEILTLESEIQEASDILKIEDLVNSILSTLEAKSTIEKDKQSLLQLKDDIVKITHQIDVLEGLTVLETPVKDLLSLFTVKDLKKKEKIDLEDLILQIDRDEKSIRLKESHLKMMLITFEDEIGDVCPLCNQPIKK
jgi:DNA repair exonuclease SbcCD ATPase subunit